MIIAASSKVTLEKVLAFIFRGSLFIATLLSISGITFFILSHLESQEKVIEEKLSSQITQPRNINSKISYHSIGSGPLSLNLIERGFSSSLKKELIVLARNKRPDAIKNQQKCLIALKSTKQEKIVKNGEIIFLNEYEKGVLRFVKDKTDFWMKPIILDSGGILIEVSKRISPEEIEKAQFLIEEIQDKAKEREQKELSLAFKRLQGAKYWGSDALLERYGGIEYQSMKNKKKIEFNDENNSHVCFVSAEDYLTWDGTHWQSISLEDADLNSPLAHIKNSSSKGLEIEAWDEKGFHTFITTISNGHLIKISHHSEQLFTGIRLRTASQVSCIMGKRRLILKQGDWLLKTQAGWHKIKTVKELEDCLQHRIKGELFIFDGLEKATGKFVFKGSLFDEMRTKVETIHIPIIMEKKGPTASKKLKKQPIVQQD